MHKYIVLLKPLFWSIQDMLYYTSEFFLLWFLLNSELWIYAMQNVGYCSIVIRLKLGKKTISFELSIRLYIRHDSPFYTSAIPSKRLQFLLHVYSLFYTSTIPSSRLQSLLHVYNPFYTSTIPSSRLQSLIHVYNPFYTSTIPSTRLQSLLHV